MIQRLFNVLQRKSKEEPDRWWLKGPYRPGLCSVECKCWHNGFCWKWMEEAVPGEKCDEPEVSA